MLNNLNELISGFTDHVSFYKTGATMEAAGILHSTYYTAGLPGQAIGNSLALSGAQVINNTITATGIMLCPLTSYGPNLYLGRMFINSSTVGTAFLMDRLWHNSISTVTTTTEQFISSYTWPSRCLSPTGGNTPNISGHNVQIAIEVSSATGNLGAITNTTMKYTNSEGVADRIATMSSFPITANAGTFVQFQLASGDKGVKMVQSITLGTNYTSGLIHLVAFRQLGIIPVPVALGGNGIDPIANCLPILFSGTSPFIVWAPSTTTATNWWGQFNFVGGN